MQRTGTSTRGRGSSRGSSNRGGSARGGSGFSNKFGGRGASPYGGGGGGGGGRGRSPYQSRGRGGPKFGSKAASAEATKEQL